MMQAGQVGRAAHFGNGSRRATHGSLTNDTRLKNSPQQAFMNKRLPHGQLTSLIEQGQLGAGAGPAGGAADVVFTQNNKT